MAALFEHETSRALDPHLHTHCIVFNATRDPDEDRWKALQNYEMLGAQKYVENVYYHELARALRSFGYTIANSARGDFELAEIPREVCERFSKRHHEIDEKTREFLASHPDKLPANENAIREHIAHKERARKAREGCTRVCYGSCGKSKSRLTNSPRCASRRRCSCICRRRTAAVPRRLSWAEAHLFERRSVVREHELWRHALEAIRGSVSCPLPTSSS